MKTNVIFKIPFSPASGNRGFDGDLRAARWQVRITGVMLNVRQLLGQRREQLSFP